MNMGRDFQSVHKEQMKIDPEYRAAYNALEQEFFIADALIKARSEAGLSQSQVAERLGVTQPTVARMESGKNISIKSIARYAKAVGRSIKLEIQPA